MPEPPWFNRGLKIKSVSLFTLPSVLRAFRITLIEKKCQHPNQDKRRILIVISLHFMQKPIHSRRLLKSQIPSTKLQIKLKLQYSMTKTVIGSFFDILSMFGILNFGHAQRRRLRRVLWFIWYLIFVIWNFPDKKGRVRTCEVGCIGIKQHEKQTREASTPPGFASIVRN